MAMGPSVDINVINPFITSIINVFKTMVQMEIKRTSLSLKKNDKVFGDITAIIGLAGTGSGNVVISFPAPLARILVAKMLGCETNTLNKADIKDGIGEIVNMVAGSAKSAFSDTKYKFSISLPTVVEGDPRNLEIGHKTNVPCIEVGFEAPDQSKFVLEVSLQSKLEE
jgi:chemotaxis protein CheX